MTTRLTSVLVSFLYKRSTKESAMFSLHPSTTETTNQAENVIGIVFYLMWQAGLYNQRPISTVHFSWFHLNHRSYSTYSVIYIQLCCFIKGGEQELSSADCCRKSFHFITVFKWNLKLNFRLRAHIVKNKPEERNKQTKKIWKVE